MDGEILLMSKEDFLSSLNPEALKEECNKKDRSFIESHGYTEWDKRRMQQHEEEIVDYGIVLSLNFEDYDG